MLLRVVISLSNYPKPQPRSIDPNIDSSYNGGGSVLPVLSEVEGPALSEVERSKGVVKESVL